ncbi:MAG: hypothetical protein ACTHMC_18595 [Pseudobacter sp.]|uniref:hypothetical protein n=1 Tax=Pseudobacter sp. TaxID=2045420 RepID=UPI003F7F0B3C
MKKAYAMLLGCMGLMLFVNNKAQAQLQKGNMLIGADLMGMSADFQSGNTTFNLSLNPKVAWFIRDNVAIGGMVNLGLTTGDGFTTFSYGVSALGRYYISDPQTQLLRQSRFLLEGQVGIMGQNKKVDCAPNTTNNGLGV